MTDDAPFGEFGDFVEQLVPVAARLITTIRTEGPDAVRAALAQVPENTGGVQVELPGGSIGALCVVLAAMVDPDAGIKSRLGWAAELLPDGDPVAAAAEEKERDRLRAAGVRSQLAARALASGIAEQQIGARRRLLHIVHGGKQSA